VLAALDINIIICNRMAKEHRQIVKFATRWVEGLRALLQAWMDGNETGLQLRKQLQEDVQKAGGSGDPLPW
jgi:hypothetical protein